MGSASPSPPRAPGQDRDVAHEQRPGAAAAALPGRVVALREIDVRRAPDGVGRTGDAHVDVGLRFAAGAVAVVAGPGRVHGDRRVGAQRARLERPVRAGGAAGGQDAAGVAEGLGEVRHGGEDGVRGAARTDAGVGERRSGIGWLGVGVGHGLLLKHAVVSPSGAVRAGARRSRLPPPAAPGARCCRGGSGGGTRRAAALTGGRRGPGWRGERRRFAPLAATATA